MGGRLTDPSQMGHFTDHLLMLNKGPVLQNQGSGPLLLLLPLFLLFEASVSLPILREEESRVAIF